MRKFKVIKLSAWTGRLALLTAFVFTACQKEEIGLNHQPALTPAQRLQSGEFEKQLDLHDEAGTFRARIAIRSDDPTALAGIGEDFLQLQPLYEITEESSSEKGKIDQQTPGMEGKGRTLHIEILDTALPDQALGYSLKVNNDSRGAMDQWWMYVFTVKNKRQIRVKPHIGAIMIKGEYSRCSSINQFIEIFGWLWIYVPQVAISTAPIDVGHHRLSVFHAGESVNDFLIEVFVDGYCPNAPNPGCPTNTQQCGNPAFNGPIPPNTLSQISRFIASDLQVGIRSLLAVYQQHQNILAPMLENDPEVQIAIREFLDQNAIFLMNGFANDHTLVTARQVEAASEVLTLIENKAKTPALQQSIREIKSVLISMEGKELKEGLKGFNRLEFSASN